MKGLVVALGALVLLTLGVIGSASASDRPEVGSAWEARPGAVFGSPTPSPTCLPSWTLVATSTLTLGEVDLYGVAAVSADDVWAVGSYYTRTIGATDARRPRPLPAAPGDPRSEAPEGGSLYRTLIYHWNGANWVVVPSASPSEDYNVLNAVDAVAPDNVWAAGTYANEYGVAQALVVRWNGASWSVIEGPSYGPLVDHQILGIDAVAPDNIWVVGTASDENGAFRTLTARWDGTSWTIVSSPNVGAYDNILTDVAAIAPDDIWAVGYYISEAGLGRALALHWNGASWSVAATPPVGSGSNALYGVDATSATDVWAVGFFYSYGTGYRTRTLSMHWDGKVWSVVANPELVGYDFSLFRSVDAISPLDVWAVGWYRDYNSGAGERALIEHWDGTRWRVVSSPNVPTAAYSELYSVSALAPNDVWAVGHYIDYWGGYFQSGMIERYSTSCVPPNCSMSFRDVQPADYYYFPVQYLYCRGAVSGYADNTFRPGNQTTRAQLSKILVLAMNWPLLGPQGPSFSDVRPWEPFYIYVETAYEHEVISGYADGTFRPNNSITRAQLCKVIVLAREWAIDTTGGPHFSDVPTNHSLYGFVETAYNHGIISGYADGTFRPGNPATRGQIAKILFTALAQVP